MKEVKVCKEQHVMVEAVHLGKQCRVCCTGVFDSDSAASSDSFYYMCLPTCVSIIFHVLYYN